MQKPGAAFGCKSIDYWPVKFWISDAIPWSPLRSNVVTTVGLRDTVLPLFRTKRWRICCHPLLKEAICQVELDTLKPRVVYWFMCHSPASTSYAMDWVLCTGGGSVNGIAEWKRNEIAKLRTPLLLEFIHGSLWATQVMKHPPARRPIAYSCRSTGVISWNYSATYRSYNVFNVAVSKLQIYYMQRCFYQTASRGDKWQEVRGGPCCRHTRSTAWYLGLLS